MKNKTSSPVIDYEAVSWMVLSGELVVNGLGYIYDVETTTNPLISSFLSLLQS